MNRKSSILTFLILAILAIGLACARKPSDAQISSEIQNKFSQDSGLSSQHLTVQASGGVVTLAGFVENEAQREAASRQAAAVDGVKEVVNNLQVGTASNASTSPTQSGQQAADTKPTPLNSTESRPTEKHAARRRDHSYSNHADSTHDNPSDHDSAANNSMANSSEPPQTTAQDAPPAEAPPPPPPPAPALPQKVTIEQGTQMSIRLVDSIDSEKNQVGDTFHASLNAPLSAEGSEAIPAGTDVAGHIVDLKSAGKFSGQSLVVLQLDTISANGRTYTLQTDQYRKEGASRGKNTAEKVGGGAIVGGIIGAIAGGGKGAAIGTAAGAGVGGGVQAASKSQQIKLPSETVLNFTLQAPVTVIRPQDPNRDRQKLGDSQ
ncbi:MAG: BON domain-containing protein [Candidatus Sulfotelmatobacter sp.]